MLKHEEESGTLSQPAAEVRVTPDELAAALSRIEARKDAGQRHVGGTIPIGEAVQQLGVETTPEEVLAEVQAIRQEPMRAKTRRLSVAQRLVLALGLGGILLGLGLDGYALSYMRSHASGQATVTGQASVSSDAPPRRISLDPNLRVTDTTGKISMLSEAGENQPVQCDFDPGTRSFQPLGDGRLFHWTLIKHNGKVYVRGKIVRVSPKVMQADGRWSGSGKPHHLMLSR